LYLKREVVKQLIHIELHLQTENYFQTMDKKLNDSFKSHNKYA